MQGRSKLAAVERSTPPMAGALPDLPMREAVLVRLVRILSSTMTDCFESVFRGSGLSENSFHVLCLLLASPNCRAAPSELSSMVGTSRANMTRILGQLHRGGWVSRTVEARDGRRHIIALTPEGRDIARTTSCRIGAPLSQSFSGLSADESLSLGALLRKLIVSLDQLT
jgi:MarR family transcriptional repressor of emrRAB